MNDPVTDASADTPSGGAPDHLEGLSAERRAAVEAGTMSVDEARAAEGLPPIEEEPKRMTLEELQAQAIVVFQLHQPELDVVGKGAEGQQQQAECGSGHGRRSGVTG